MPSHPRTFLGFVLLATLPLVFAGTLVPAALDAPTAYDILERYGFPRGILPEGVTSYLLTTDGSFDVYFNDDCDFKVTGGYTLHYKSKISGKIDVGKLTELSGVSVKVLFLYIGIDEVWKNGDELDFYVGPLSASFPVANFVESPSCRCSFNCRSAGNAGLSAS